MHRGRPRGEVDIGFSLEQWVRQGVEAGRMVFCEQREREGMREREEDACVNLDEKRDRSPWR